MRAHRHLATLCLAATLATSADAREPDREARDAYSQGQARYELGDYAQAIESFKRAYERSRAPLLLFNIAQAYRLQGDWAHALQSYRTYLRIMPNAPNRSDVEGFMAECGVRLANPTVPPPTSPSPEQPRAAGGATRALSPAPATGAGPPLPTTNAAVDASHAERRGRAELAGGLTVAVVGVAALATGGWFAARRASDLDKLASLRAQQGSWDAAAQSTYDDGRRSATAATVLFVSGAVLAGAGVVLAIVGGVHLRRARVQSLAIVPARGGGAAVWSCAF